jgi:DNA-directed RNA polymerase specialized sigma24 family protein
MTCSRRSMPASRCSRRWTGCPARQRAVVVLRYFADQTESQTAEAMGCSVGAVKAHAAKAMAKLRDAPGLSELLSGGVTS